MPGVTECNEDQPGADSGDEGLDLVGVHEVLQAICRDVDALDHRDPMSPEESIEVWHAAAAVLDAFVVVLGQMEHQALNAMIELGHEEHRTSFGPVHLDYGYAKEAWDGDGVIGALSRKLIDTDTGEYVDAVPAHVLRKVLPAVKPGATSSKWSKPGLIKAGVKVDAYYKGDTEKPRVIRRGRKFWR